MSTYSNYDFGRTQVLGYGASFALGLIGVGTLTAGLIAHHVVTSFVGGGLCFTAATVASCIRIKLEKMKEANEHPNHADRAFTYSYVKPINV